MNDEVTITKQSLAEVVDGLTLVGSLALIAQTIEGQEILGVPTNDFVAAIDDFIVKLKAAAEEKMGVTFE